MQPTIYGALRVRNEARWIQRVIRAIKPICGKIFVLDDRSEDETPDICEAEGCTVYRSEVPWVKIGDREFSDESAGKDFLLQRMFDEIPIADKHYTRGNPTSPYWALCIDGDEELADGDGQHVITATRKDEAHAYTLRIPYLWDNPKQIRIDGVYARFEKVGRPSLFRLMNTRFRYLRTPFGNGCNFHCSSIPQELLGHARPCKARLWHWGYIDKADRIRKYLWYNTVDPGNKAEDYYRHIVQGDVPEVPADARLKHAGPLLLRAIG